LISKEKNQNRSNYSPWTLEDGMRPHHWKPTDETMAHKTNLVVIEVIVAAIIHQR
jgi:hypothetical protein